MKMVQRCCAGAFRITSQSRRRAQSLTAIWPTNTGEPSFQLARLLRISHASSLAQAHSSPLSPCLETTQAAGKAIGRRLCRHPLHVTPLVFKTLVSMHQACFIANKEPFCILLHMLWMHLNPSRNQIFAKCRNTIKEACLEF